MVKGYSNFKTKIEINMSFRSGPQAKLNWFKKILKTRKFNNNKFLNTGLLLLTLIMLIGGLMAASNLTPRDFKIAQASGDIVNEDIASLICEPTAAIVNTTVNCIITTNEDQSTFTGSVDVRIGTSGIVVNCPVEASGTTISCNNIPVGSNPGTLTSQYSASGSSSVYANGNDIVVSAEPFNYTQTLNASGFSWVDATDGDSTGLFADDNSILKSLPFTFNFYGNAYNSMYISSNGLISFNGANSSYSNTVLPSTGTSSRNIIAPYWADLYNGGGQGTIYTKTIGDPGNQTFVIEWNQVQKCCGSGSLTFQVLLSQNGAIAIQYLNMSELGSSASIGLSDSLGLVGRQAVYRSNVLTNNYRITYEIPNLNPAIQNSDITSLTCNPVTGIVNTTVNCTIITNVDQNTLSGSVNVRIGDSGTIVNCPIAASGTSISCNNIPVGNNGGTFASQYSASGSSPVYANGNDIVVIPTTPIENSNISSLTCNPTTAIANTTVNCTITTSTDQNILSGSVNVRIGDSGTVVNCPLAASGTTLACNNVNVGSNGGTLTSQYSASGSSSVYVNGNDIVVIPITPIQNSNISSLTCNPTTAIANTTVNCTITTSTDQNILSGSVNVRIGDSGTVVNCPLAASGTTLACNNVNVGTNVTTLTSQFAASGSSSTYINGNDIVVEPIILAPNTGNILGGTTVTFTGAGFSNQARVVKTSSGSLHTCALLSNGSVKCWGYNGNGQLGYGDTANLSTPGVDIPLGDTATQITSGYFHTCALLSNGSVKCWGNNGNGQLGYGDFTQRNAPGPSISLGSTATQISSRGAHTCALLSNGNVKCWGSNFNGQLGYGNTTTRNTPGPDIALGGTAIQVITGGDHTCAVLTAGNVKCWGSNSNGQLGYGDSTQRNAPGPDINLGSNAISANAGFYHTCALLSTENVKCWGANSSGQLGYGDTTQRNAPGPDINLGANATSISTSSYHTCALLSNGNVKCWGENYNGQLGYGDYSQRNAPGPDINMGTAAAFISTGGGNTCAVLSTSNVKCWGNNEYGQLGYGDTIQRNIPDANIVPVLVTFTVTFDGIAASSVTYVNSTTITAVTPARSEGIVNVVLTNGDSSTYNLNNGYTYAVPRNINNLDIASLSCSPTTAIINTTVNCIITTNINQNELSGSVNVRIGDSGLVVNCPVNASGTTITCNNIPVGANSGTFASQYSGSGNNSVYSNGNNVAVIPITLSPTSGNTVGGTTVTFTGTGFTSQARVVQTSAGQNHTCTLLSTGNVRCWGYNGNGQLGYGDTTNRSSALSDINLGVSATQISTGENNTCALLSNGNVKCWGYNGNGELGYGDTVQRNAPGSEINLGATTIQIIAGRFHTCALLSTGSVKCWGANFSGQLGYGDNTQRNAPGSDINLGAAATQVSVGDVHTCAILSSGNIKCWGGNFYGQLGYGDTTSRNAPGPDIVLATSATKITLGGSSTCAILSSGKAKCWGDNSYGQLGYGDTTSRSVPGSDLSLGANARQISVGPFHTCALLSNEKLKCWGANFSGQLGYGDYSLRTLPGQDIVLGANSLQVAAGSNHTCAVLSADSVKCWGDNSYGKLGYGDTIGRASPASDSLSILGNLSALFDGIAATSVTIVNPTTISAVTPAHADGLVNVVLTNGDGAAFNLNNAYTYAAPPDVVNSNISSLTCTPTTAIANTNVNCTITTNVDQNTLSGSVNIRIGDSGTVVNCPLVPSGTTITCNNINVGSNGGTFASQYSASGSSSVYANGNDIVVIPITPIQNSNISALVCNPTPTVANTTVNCTTTTNTDQNILSGSVNIRIGDSGTVVNCPLVPSGTTITCNNIPVGNNGGTFASQYSASGSSPVYANGNDIVVVPITITPNVGSTVGGSNVTLSGTRFTPQPRVIQTSVGANHSCALLSSGNVKCWGANYYGQLGVGSFINSNLPGPDVDLGATATMVVAGDSHTCAILSNGNVKCWGYNGNGQLGYGDTSLRTIPGPEIALGATATMVTTGQSHTCALLSNGNVKCWGYNGYSQLGYGDNIDRSSPGPDVDLGATATMVTTGQSHTCALLSTGNVKCWGYNGNGQLGYGDFTSRTLPGPDISLGGAVTQLNVGSNHTCALLSNGNVKCWGNNGEGQLGYGDTTQRNTPGSDIALGDTASQIATGFSNTCALLSSGNVKCWGANYSGQLGYGDTTRRTSPGSNIALGLSANQVSVGSSHVCSVLSNESVKCWGGNSNGQLGNGNTTELTSPANNSISIQSLLSLSFDGIAATSVTYVNPTTIIAVTPAHAEGLVNVVLTNGDGAVYNLNDLYTYVVPRTITNEDIASLVCSPSSSFAEFNVSCIITTNIEQNNFLGSVDVRIGTSGTVVNCPVAVIGSTIICNNVPLGGNAGTLTSQYSASGSNSVYVNGNDIVIAPAKIPIQNSDISSLVCNNASNTIYVNSLVNCTITTNVDQTTLSGSVNVRITTSGTVVNCPVAANGTTVSCNNIPVGSNPGTLTSQYSASGSNSVYADGANIEVILPTITPNSGNIAGGSNVTFTGVGFTSQARVVQTSAGEYHTCALTSVGNVKCWGENSNGQLGYGNTTNRNSPGPDIALGSTATQVSVGNRYTCAVLSTGNVKCWGANFNSQLGYGDTVQRNLPGPDIALGATATQVSAGTSHTCALLSTGNVKCWGNNQYGQLGYGDTANRNLPGPDIALGATATQVSVGRFHTCALLSTGNVKCWGYNGYGELGYGDDTNRNLPGPDIALGNTATQVFAGEIRTCAVLSNGSVKCWGYNGNGELGYGDNVSRNLPGPDIALGSTATLVSGGTNHTCALLSTGNLKCWGFNSNGQLGYGNTANRNTPGQDIALGGVATQISTGAYQTCALLSSANVKCWGGNFYGQLGYGDLTGRTSPASNSISMPGSLSASFDGMAASFVTVVNSTTITAVTPAHAAGLVNVVLTNGDGTVYNLNNAYTYAVPRPIINSDITSLTCNPNTVMENGAVNCTIITSADQNILLGSVNVRIGISGVVVNCPLVASGPTITCNNIPTSSNPGTLTSQYSASGSGSVYANGGDVTVILPTITPNSGNIAGGSSVTFTGAGFTSQARVVQTSAGKNHTCTVLSTGKVRCWGYNLYGQLGYGDDTDRNTAGSDLDLGGAATQISAGERHTCALLSSGNVKCWGYNGWGQLGYGDYTDRNTPGPDVDLGGAATQIITSTDRTCALLSSGNVKCWGYNNYGELGYGDTASRDTPGPDVDLGGAATKIISGTYHTCALLSTGSVKCWGDNSYGQLGYGDTTQRTSPESDIDLGGTATQITVGDSHTCALLSSGNVKCWGYNGYGQLGYGNTTNRNTPGADIALGAATIQLTAGANHTCSILSTGNVKCWGYNGYGQLGYGNTTNRNTPGLDLVLGGTATQVSAGDNHTCAQLSTGNVKCWGYNFAGQLGYGDTTQRTSPASNSINIQGSLSATFDGVAASSVTAVNSTTITALTPARAPGLVNVVLTNGDGTQYTGLTYLYASRICTWTGSINSNFSNSGNWTNCQDSIPNSETSIIFPSSASTYNLNNDIVGLSLSTVVVESLNSQPYILSGNNLNVSAGISTTAGSGDFIFNTNVTSCKIEGSGNITINAGKTYTTGCDSLNSQFSGNINGTGTFVKNGQSNLIFTANQKIDPNFILNSGTLEINYSSATTLNGTVDVNNGTIWVFGNLNVPNSSINLNNSSTIQQRPGLITAYGINFNGGSASSYGAWATNKTTITSSNLNLNGTRLDLSFFGNTVGETRTLIETTNGNVITGEFSNLPAGSSATFQNGDKTVQVSATYTSTRVTLTVTNIVINYCSGTETYSESSGNVSSGSSAYRINSNCRWIIAPVNAESVTLDFNNLETEEGVDVVKVYDGLTTDSLVLGEFSGNNLPSSITSNSGLMVITFTSNDSNIDPNADPDSIPSDLDLSGFNANWTSALTPNPSISSVSPTYGPASGGTNVTVNGANFVEGQYQDISSIGSTNYDGIRGMVVDSTGQYVSGEFTGTITLGFTTLVSSGEQDIYIAKIDSAGNYLWATKAGGSTRDGFTRKQSMGNDEADNAIVVAGYYSGTATFGSTTLTGSVGSNVFIAKINKTTGEFIWAKGGGGTANTIFNVGTEFPVQNGTNVDVDDAGNIYFSGKVSGSTATFGNFSFNIASSFGEFFIAKLSPNGDYIWVKHYPYSAMLSPSDTNGDNGEMHGLTVDSNGNVYTTMGYTQSITFGSTTLNSLSNFSNGTGSSSNIAILKLNSSGNEVWAVNGGTVGPINLNTDLPYGIKLDSAENVYVTGYFGGSVGRFGTIDVNGSLTGATVFTAKLTSTGVFQWVKSLPSPGFGTSRDLFIDSNDRIWIGGGYSSALTDGIKKITGAGTNAFFAQYDTSGNLVQLNGIGGTGGRLAIGGVGGNQVRAVYEYNGKLYIAGEYFDTVGIGGITITSEGDQDGFYTNFNPNDISVTVCGVELKGTYISSGQLTATTLPSNGLSQTVSVSNSNGQSASLENAFTCILDLQPTPDTSTTPESTPITIDVLANDANATNICVGSINLGSNAANGIATIVPSGTAGSTVDKILFTPTIGYFGTTSFTYTACSTVAGTNPSSETTVTITVTPVNPVAVNDTVTTDQNNSVTIDVLANDSDPSAQVLTICIPLSSPSNGSIAKTVIGTVEQIIFTPTPGYSGNTSFTYTACDPAGNPSNTATVDVTVIPNIAPVANDDTSDGSKNNPIVINVTGNDTDSDGNLDLTSVTIETVPTKGTVNINPVTGEATYTPTPSSYPSSGSDTFTYKIKDNDGDYSNIATVTISITVVLPIANPDSGTLNSNSAIVIDVLANDTNATSICTGSVPATTPNGTAIISGNQITYTPNNNYTGTDTFTYKACNIDGESSTTTVTITVNNTPPVAVNDTITLPAFNPADVDVSANDTDAEGNANLDKASIVITTQPATGTVSVNTTSTSSDFGKVTYTPNANSNIAFVSPFSDTFGYTIKDSGSPTLESNSATVTVLYTPVAANDTATTNQGVPVVIDVLTNDLAASTVCDFGADNFTSPAKGILTLSADKRSFTYTPDSSSVGSDSFTYKTCNPNGSSSFATASITINPNQPEAIPDTAITPEFTSVTIPVLTNDINTTNICSGSIMFIDPVTLSPSPTSSNGSATIVTVGSGSGAVDNVFFSPIAGYTGNITLTYTACSTVAGTNPSSETTVTITVTPVNPVAVNDTVTTDQNNSVTIDVLANDSDPSAQDLAICMPLSSVSNSNGTIAKTVIGTVEQIIFTPTPGYSGNTSFTYTACDPAGNPSNTATVDVTVIPNIAPVANPELASTVSNFPVVINSPANDIDSDGSLDLTTVAIVENPAKGTVSVNPTTGRITYTANTALFIANGTDTFTYRIKDNDGDFSNEATVTVNVVVDPVANSDTASGLVSSTTVLNVAANDTATSAPLDLGSVTIVTQPTKGTVSVNTAVGDPNEGKVTYTPTSSSYPVSGTDSFTYIIRDTQNHSSNTATATINITVPPANQLPVANNDAASGGKYSVLVVEVAANDTDGDGTLDLGSVIIVTQPTKGTVSVNTEVGSPDFGKVTYTPTSSSYTESSTDFFTYKIKDNQGDFSNEATVNITVTLLLPAATNDAATLDINSPTTIDVLANDTLATSICADSLFSTADGGTPTASQSTAGGSLVIQNGKIIYTPANNFTGSDSFVYKACNNDGESNTATVNLTVNALPVIIQNIQLTLYKEKQDANILLNQPLKIQADITNPNNFVVDKIETIINIDTTKLDFVSGSAREGSIVGTKYLSFLEGSGSMLASLFSIPANAQTLPATTVSFQVLSSSSLKITILNAQAGQTIPVVFDVLPKASLQNSIQGTSDIIDPITNQSIASTSARVEITPNVPPQNILVRTGGETAAQVGLSVLVVMIVFLYRQSKKKKIELDI